MSFDSPFSGFGEDTQLPIRAWTYGKSKYGGQDKYGGSAVPIVVSVGYVTEDETLFDAGVGQSIVVAVTHVTEDETLYAVGVVQPQVISVTGVTEDETLFNVSLDQPQSIAVSTIYEDETLFDASPTNNQFQPWTYGKSKFGSADKYGGTYIPASGPKNINVLPIYESETLFDATVSKPIITPVGYVTEDEALYSVLVEKGLSTLYETETLFDVTPVKPIIVSVGTVTEDGSLFTVTPILDKRVAVTTIYEEESLFDIAIPAFFPVGTVTETETLFDVLYDSGEKVVHLPALLENERLFRISTQDEGVTYNRFVIDPINNGTLNPIKLTNPLDIQWDEKGLPLVNFSGSMFTQDAADIDALRQAFMEIVLDRQIVDISYPPDDTVSGYFYIRDVRLTAVNLASGLYRYSFDAEKTLVSSG